MADKETPGKPAPARTGGAAAVPGKKQRKPKKPRKPMPRFLLVALTILVFLLLLGGAGYCLYTNVAGIADKAMVLFPQYRVSMADLEKQKKDLADAEAKLRQDRDKVTADADANVKAAEAVKAGQAQLENDKKAFEQTKQDAQTAEQKQQLVLDVYAKLDATDAADMLVKAPTLAEAADILRRLSPDKMTEIIEAVKAIDAQKAYDLTKLIGQ